MVLGWLLFDCCQVNTVGLLLDPTEEYCWILLLNCHWIFLSLSIVKVTSPIFLTKLPVSVVYNLALLEVIYQYGRTVYITEFFFFLKSSKLHRIVTQFNTYG